jgi:hypothetical protein
LWRRPRLKVGCGAKERRRLKFCRHFMFPPCSFYALAMALEQIIHYREEVPI